jgi:HemY protein
MMRALWLFLLIALIALGASQIADIPGTVTITRPDLEVSLSIPVAVVGVIVLSIATILAYRVITAFVDAPAEFFRWRAMGRQTRGLAAVTKGLVAVAAGDDEEARKQTRKALSLVGEPPLALLLAAQAAQMEGDDEAAQRYFTQMLQSKETEFLGLRGLYMSAIRRQDISQALLIAERARLLRPKTRWALAALFELNVGVRKWTEAAAAVDMQVKARQLDPAIAKRRKAVLATAGAQAARAAGEGEVAARLAEDALALVPGFGPAAIIAAESATAQGKLWRAASLIEAAWSRGPHPDLARAYASMRAEEPPQARAKRLSGLAAMNPHHPESRILAAAASMSQGRFQEASEHLRPLTDNTPTVRVCMIMSEIERGLAGESMLARDWATRALKAPQDATWACDACLRTQNEWAATCNACGAFDTLTWQSGATDAETRPAADSITTYTTAVGNAAPLYRHTVKAQPGHPQPPRGPQDSRTEYSPMPDGDAMMPSAPRAPDDPGPEAEDYTLGGGEKKRKRRGLW